MNTDPSWGSPTESQAPGPYYPAPPAPQYPAGSYVPPPPAAGIAPPYYTPPPPPPQPTNPPVYPGYPPYGSAPGGGYLGYYAGPMPPSTNGLAIASLICSIASFVVLPFVGGVLGVVLGHVALAQIGKSDGREEGRGMAIAGLIIGYANVALCLLAFVFFIILIVVAANQQPAAFVV